MRTSSPTATRSTTRRRHPTETADLEQMRLNYGRFLDATLPVAEAAGVRLALHPDDPPVPGHRWRRAAVRQPRGARLGDGAERRQPRLGDGPVPRAPSRRWSAAPTRSPGRSTSSDHPDGSSTSTSGRSSARCHGSGRRSSARAAIAPAQVLRHLADVGFDGFLLDDHVPHMVGDTPYGHRARAHAIGYMQGLLEALAIGGVD